MKVRTNIKAGGLSALNHSFKLAVLALLLAACGAVPQENIGETQQALATTLNVFVLRPFLTGHTVTFPSHSDTGPFATAIKRISYGNGVAGGIHGIQIHWIEGAPFATTQSAMGCVNGGSDFTNMMGNAVAHYQNAGISFTNIGWVELDVDNQGSFAGLCSISSTGGRNGNVLFLPQGVITTGNLQPDADPISTIRALHEFAHGSNPNASGFVQSHVQSIYGCSSGKFDFGAGCVVSEVGSNGMSQYWVDPLGANLAGPDVTPDLTKVNYNAVEKYAFGFLTSARVTTVPTLPNTYPTVQTTINMACSDAADMPASPSSKALVLFQRPDGRVIGIEHRCTMPVNEQPGNGIPVPHGNIPGLYVWVVPASHASALDLMAGIRRIPDQCLPVHGHAYDSCVGPSEDASHGSPAVIETGLMFQWESTTGAMGIYQNN